MGGWMGGRESGVKDCLQQSKIEQKSLNFRKVGYWLTKMLKKVRNIEH
jgi:hypothetical protein